MSGLAPGVEVVVAAVSEWLPSTRGVVVRLQAPLEFAAAVPTWVEPSNTFTVLLAAAVPVSVSVLSLVIPSPTAPLSAEKETMAGVAVRGGSVTNVPP